MHSDFTVCVRFAPQIKILIGLKEKLTGDNSYTALA